MILPDDANLKKTTSPVISGPSGISAERKEPFAQPPEKAPIVERVPPKEMEPGVKDWLKKLETGEDIQLPQPVTDNQGQVIVSPSSPQQVKVTLPLTDEEMNRALHLKIIYAVRWLAEWMKRLLKIVGGKFTYKTES